MAVTREASSESSQRLKMELFAKIINFHRKLHFKCLNGVLNTPLYMYVTIIRNRDGLRVDKEAGKISFQHAFPKGFRNTFKKQQYLMSIFRNLF